jgi:hypothetical protein
LEGENPGDYQERNADREDGRIEDDSSPRPLRAANRLLVQEPFSRLGRHRDKPNQFRHGPIKVLLINKFIRTILTRYRGAHGTVS